MQLGDGCFTKLKLSSVRKHLAAGRGKYDADGIFVFTKNPPEHEASRIIRRHYRAEVLAQAAGQLPLRRTAPGKMQSPTITVLANPTPEHFREGYHGLPPGHTYPTPSGGNGVQFPALARMGAGLR